MCLFVSGLLHSAGWFQSFTHVVARARTLFSLLPRRLTTVGAVVGVH